MATYPVFVPGGLNPGERASLSGAERSAERAAHRTCLYCGKELPAGPAFGVSA